MPCLTVPSRSRASSQAWTRVAVLALVGLSAAGCSGSGRFDSNPFASDRNAPAPGTEVTGSVTPRSAPTGRVEAQPLPAVSRPATVSANGYSSGAQGLGAYRPNADVTGSVTTPAKPAGHWTWDGGSPVTVGQGETVDMIARKHGVPAAAIMQTNGISSPSAVRPGQRLVIPRYVSGSEPVSQAPRAQAPQIQSPQIQSPQVQAPQSAPVQSAAAGSVHVVQPGESLIAIARRNGLTLNELARANNIQPYTKVNMGDRITIPAHARPVAQQRPATAPVAQPQVAQLPQQQQRPPQVEKVSSIPAQSVRMATQETPPAAEPNPVKEAEAAGSMPSFRWPVKGRIITAFGTKVNGVTNDGINLAVPEGTPVKAAEDGVVAYAGNELKGYGNLVLVRHANGFVSAYANASELLVKRGESVKRGQTIAHAGQTGNVTSPQLHFEIRKGSTPVDPTKYLGGV